MIDQKFISPLGLAGNFVLYNLSGSILVVDIRGACEGSGKFDQIKNISDRSVKINQTFVEPCDVAYTYDNEQVKS